MNDKNEKLNPPVTVSNLPKDRFVRDIVAESMASKIVVPEGYAIENNIKIAYLRIVQEGYFKTCDIQSIVNAVLDMVVQGLSLVKDQGYFIKHSNRLKFMRSYLGSIAVARRFNRDVEKVNYAAIYGGDEFKIDIIKGIRYVRDHKQDFANVRKDNITGAYAISLDDQGNDVACDVMTFEDIMESWRRSQKSGPGQPILADGRLNPNSDHGRHPDRFACRTVVNRLCKMLISVTDDEQLLRAVRKSDPDVPYTDIIDLEVYENSNQSTIDFDQDTETNGQAPPPPEEDKTLTIEIPPPVERRSIEPKTETTPPAVEPEVETVPEPIPATDDQCDTIFKFFEEKEQLEVMLHVLSEFVDRDVDGLKELTADEAKDFIDKENFKKDNQGPTWE